MFGIENNNNADRYIHSADKAKADAGWRILSNSNEPGLSDDGTLTPEQMQKAQTIAAEVLEDV